LSPVSLKQTAKIGQLKHTGRVCLFLSFVTEETCRW